MPNAPTQRFPGDPGPELFAPVTAEVTGDTASMKLYGRIDSDGAPWGVSADEFGQALDALSDDVKQLEVHVHSRGGDAFDGLAIMNQLRQHPAEVHVIVDGLAASAASYIAMGGKTLSMAPNSQLMIHDASGIGIGQANDIRTLADSLDKISANIADVYAKKAGGTAAEWRTAMQPETWYTAAEAVKAGLADRVLPTAAAKQPSARYDLSIFAYAGREAAPEPFIPTATQTPAEPQVTPPTDHKEADIMSDTIPTAGLVKALGLADDADEDAILEAVEAKVTADAALAKAQADLTAATAKIPTAGTVVVDAQQWDDVKAMAAKGAQASARQSAEDRDAAVAGLIRDGKISRNAENVAKLKADWDADVEAHGDADMTRQRFADMAVLYPTAKVAAGYSGSEDDGKTGDVMTEAQAKAIAAQTGVNYKELMSA